MLGGSVVIAFIRFGVSLAGTILLYSILSEPRYNKKQTIVRYTVFSLVLMSAACIWYVLDWESCVRIVAFAMFICFSFFAVSMSCDPLFLSVYKLALTFYLLAVFLIGGLEVSILFFGRNVWVDIAVRTVLIGGIAFLLEKYVKKSIRGFSHYVEYELDHFSVTVMVISILFGIGFILNPNLAINTPFRLFQIATNFILTGALQLLVFRLYLHIGKEKEYEREKQLMEMNQRLLERNLEILEDSVETSRRIRHDVRHHNAVIAEYARLGQVQELLQYVKEYQKETEAHTSETICANMAVNHVLCAYTRKARKEQIKVIFDVSLDKYVAIPNIDLITILANAYENAIYGCIEVKKQNTGRECVIYLKIQRKKNKLAVFCSNTCRMETELKDGKPKPEFTGGIGVLSIIKTAEKYEGEYDFQNNKGVFVFRLVLKIPQTEADEI